jgi:hypothetical protein
MAGSEKPRAAPHGGSDSPTYMQVSWADPLIFDEVFWIPLFTEIVRSTGAVPTTCTTPMLTQVAVPLSPTVAIAWFEVSQVSPSAIVSVRLELLSKVPLAVNSAVPRDAAVAVAEVGEIVILLSRGWPAPHPAKKAAPKIMAASCSPAFIVFSPASRMQLRGASLLPRAASPCAVHVACLQFSVGQCGKNALPA